MERENECVFCGGPHQIFLDEDIDEDAVDACDNCGRMTCMDCALFSFNDTGLNAYLCPDCGRPPDQVMRAMGAPMLFPELTAAGQRVVVTAGEEA